MSSISKASADRQKRVLTELLALPGNNVCADCQSPAPRWASWNLGIFLCVQCATAHRKLGSHISKVKSVTLDTWTKEQVESMKNMGNIKANELYNPDPLRNPPPTNMEDGERDSEIETYIRNKYQYKAFMKREPAKEKSSSSSALRSDAPSSSGSSNRRPPDIIVRTNRAPSSKAGTIPSPSPNIREAIEAVSPSASSFLSEMQSHTRELQMGNRDRARSTPPNAAASKSSRPSTATDGNKGMEFTSVGVTPPASSARPSTGTSKLGSVPSITTTPPVSGAAVKGRSATAGGGFSWGSGPSASTGPTTSSAAPMLPSVPQPATTAAPTTTAPAPTATTTAPPPPQPQRELSLFEKDMMLLQAGMTNPAPSNPPLVPSLPATNPFPMGLTNGPPGALSASPPPFVNGVTASQSPFGMTASQSPFGATALSPATSPFANGLATGTPGGINNVQSLTTGFASMSMGGTGLGASNPFGVQTPSQGLGTSPSPFGSLPPQPTGAVSLGQMNPFGAMQSPPAVTSPPFVQMQPTGAPFQPSTSPFQQPSSSPFQQPSSSPFQPSSSPFQASTSPFQPSSSPFQPSASPFQAGSLQTQPTGLSSSPFGAAAGSFQPSPFQTQPGLSTPGSFNQSTSPFGQQPQFTGMSQASTFSNASTGSAGAGFAAFAQGMLPKAPGQQPQMGAQGSFNPFLQQQQQQQSGAMGWMR